MDTATLSSVYSHQFAETGTLSNFWAPGANPPKNINNLLGINPPKNNPSGSNSLKVASLIDSVPKILRSLSGRRATSFYDEEQSFARYTIWAPRLRDSRRGETKEQIAWSCESLEGRQWRKFNQLKPQEFKTKDLPQPNNDGPMMVT
jgi:hypothetical protein